MTFKLTRPLLLLPDGPTPLWQPCKRGDEAHETVSTPAMRCPGQESRVLLHDMLPPRPETGSPLTPNAAGMLSAPAHIKGCAAGVGDASPALAAETHGQRHYSK